MDKDTILDYVTETPGNTNRAVLGSMLDSVEGASLPAVTSDDNGMVLTVIEGVWDKAEGGGGSVLEVKISFDPEANLLKTDKTWNEIKDAFPGVTAEINVVGTTAKGIVSSIVSSEGKYGISVIIGGDILQFIADDPDECLLMISEQA